MPRTGRPRRFRTYYIGAELDIDPPEEEVVMEEEIEDEFELCPFRGRSRRPDYDDDE